jgi:hypothetical protein
MQSLGAGTLGGSTTDSSNSSLAAAAGAAGAAAPDHHDEHQQHLLYAPYHSSNTAAAEHWTGFGDAAGASAAPAAAGVEGYQLQQRPHEAMQGVAVYHGYDMLPEHHQDITAYEADPNVLSPNSGSAAAAVAGFGHLAAAEREQQQQRGSSTSRRSSKISKHLNPDGTPKPKGRSGPKSKFSPFIGVSQYKRTGRWEARNRGFRMCCHCDDHGIGEPCRPAALLFVLLPCLQAHTWHSSSKGYLRRLSTTAVASHLNPLPFICLHAHM